MSIIGTPNWNESTGTVDFDTLKLEIDEQKGIVKNDAVGYTPTDEEAAVRSMILLHFQLGTTIMYTPRVEFSDLSVIYRDQVDWMSWNTYQPNNGLNAPGDQVNGWRSNAIRPVVRNQCISIAAHVTARLIFPKVFAENVLNEDDKNAAEVMMDLMQWRGEQVNYADTSLRAVIQAEVAPLSIVHTEYSEVFRKVKREKNDKGRWVESFEIDTVLSGFKDTIVPVDQFYLSNFFEPDIQKQDWVIWRRVQSHSLCESKYGHRPNWKYVKPGMQVLFNDANQTFYFVYDPSMRGYLDEEVIYYNRKLDLKIELVNGVMMSDYDQPNPRNDKLYPFVTFGYEEINARCAYYKSLAFKLQHDANIINTLYPMIIDGTYLNIMPPMINSGGEMINSGVIVPGAVTTLSSPDAKLNPVKLGADIQSGLSALNQVEKSLDESSISAINAGGQRQTAYSMAILQQQQQLQLGTFMQMIGSWVKQYGSLAMGDILQYLTIGDAADITGDTPLVYKTFNRRNKTEGGKTKTRRIKFDPSLPLGKVTDEEHLKLSQQVLKEGGGLHSDTELWKVNPEIFRDLKYNVVVSPDVINPLSEDAERQYGLEDYDRIIQSPFGNQEEALRELILGRNPITKKNVDKFVQQPQQGPGAQPVPGAPTGPNGSPTGAGATGSAPGSGTVPSQIANHVPPIQSPVGAGANFNLQNAVQGSPGR